MADTFLLLKRKAEKEKDGIDLLEEVKRSHIFLSHKDELTNFDFSQSGKIFGLFANEALRQQETPENHETEPEMKQMLDFAVSRSEKLCE